MECTTCKREIAATANFCQFCGAAQAIAQPQTFSRKRLMRSPSDSKVAGVCGGLAEYLDTDPGIVRILWALSTIVSGVFFGVLVYIVAWVILPLSPRFNAAAVNDYPMNAAPPAPVR